VVAYSAPCEFADEDGGVVDQHVDVQLAAVEVGGQRPNGARIGDVQNGGRHLAGQR